MKFRSRQIKGKRRIHTVFFFSARDMVAYAGVLPFAGIPFFLLLFPLYSFRILDEIAIYGCSREVWRWQDWRPAYVQIRGLCPWEL